MLNYFLKYKPFYKSNFLLVYPVVISQLGQMLTAIGDTVMVGQLGTIPLAACALANSILSIFLVSGIGISQGITPIVAQENGKGNKKICGLYLEQGVIISIFSGIFLFGIVALIAQHLHLLAQPFLVEIAAKDYLLVIAASIVPLMVFQIFRQFAEGLGYTRQAMFISIAGNALNILFNFILIYGWWGFPAYGLFGAGIGTLVSRIFMALAMGFYVIKSSLFTAYLSDFKIHRPDWNKIKKIVKLGFPIALQYFFEIGAFSGAAIMIGWIGAVELAAHQIAINLAAFTYMGASGIAAAATIKAGNAMGKKDFKEIKLSAISSYHLVMAYMLATAFIFLTCNQLLPRLYINNAAVTALASQLLILAAFFQLSDGIQVVGAGVLRGLSDVKIPTIITLVAYWVIGLPLGYVLGFTFHLGPQGIWISLSIALTASATLLYFRFRNMMDKLAFETV
ncbi:MATE family efflux transporter [Pedobacter sp. SD-b]|uniref:Multidrug-efflux transporter n=1 Tax=Pedobacter segetis TaxID=2793069 RepID=A0ABS1BM72_9SPHI|nr:MATE family efflux transporter [Pedobacter segetis]MBK0383980.1 MATE family efflux transporter [Pedobacter segetis]